MNNQKTNSVSVNNKRIAKNTLYLYIRMGLVMCVSLYTVRVVLKVLGAVDYGIYNVIGGIVVMFSFLSSTLASASQRFFAFELGKGDEYKLNQTFCVTLQLYVLLSIVIFVFSETIGLWYLNTHMIIPCERQVAAQWIYQFSIISYLLKMFATPYQAMVIAQERMNVYAVVGILEVILNLVIAFLIECSTSDKLILYGLFIMTSSLLVSSMYVLYSYKKFNEVHYHYVGDKQMTIEIMSYSGWTLFSGIANIVRSQGINLLLNAFFNPVVNAARGIAYQINNAVNLFSSNFYTAVRPQLTKYYAQDYRNEWLDLTFSSSKYCGYLVLIFAIPLFTFADVLLNWWLVDVPKYAVIFTRLVIITAFVDSMTNPLATLVQATGVVKKYHIVVGGLLILNLPLSFVLLKIGFGPEATMYVSIVLSLISLHARLLVLKQLVDYPIIKYHKRVSLPTVLVVACSSTVIMLAKPFFADVSGFIGIVETFGFSIVSCMFFILVFGLSSDERNTFRKILLNKIRKNE